MLARQTILNCKPTSGLIFTRGLRLIPDFSKIKSKFELIPQPPGYIVGTVNDAYIPPPTAHIEGSYHWTYERAITVGMVPLMMTPFVVGIDFPMVDATLSTLLLWHCHAGFKSCIIDYIPKRVYGIWYKISCWLLTTGTFVGMYGIYVMETSSNGLFDLVSKIWSA
ncbi:Succinate dehydrogenase ubiquinone cytochrome b small subunit mitochondrial [Spathaspora sp. JA1]|nr:Succinate dehydrogenase ubiquinone cytochrome b small subunit mitochondrial [Spathaspora sp. JA1]